MLFNSYGFIFLFLPITLILFFLTSKYSLKLGLGVLLFASIVFYGWSDQRNLYILLPSIIINYALSCFLLLSVHYKKLFMLIGVMFNLVLLIFFKYTNFLIQNINAFFNTHISTHHIALPIGISFYTFTQIAFLVDCYRQRISKPPFLNYALFVTYFPHLIAGPIIHHQEVMPQFNKQRIFHWNYRAFSLGITIFAMGLCKKTLLADRLGVAVAPVFDFPIAQLSTFESWIAALSYTLELYFDFSGYSDMAIGLSMLFGIKLPVNFYSPYKAVNIIDFWRRWNITLSRFLRDYLYIPLGGNRHGKGRRYSNLMISLCYSVDCGMVQTGPLLCGDFYTDYICV